MKPMQVVSSRDVPADFVADFVNTQADGAGHVEFFATPTDLRAWGVRRDVLEDDAAVSASDLLAAQELREALRTLLLAHAGDPELDEADRAAAEDYLRQAGPRYPLSTVVTADGAELRAQTDGVPGMLATVMAAVAETAHSGEWSRVKACCSPVCHFAFVDRTRNHSGRYCCAGCASRVSMRAVRERQRRTVS